MKSSTWASIAAATGFALVLVGAMVSEGSAQTAYCSIEEMGAGIVHFSCPSTRVLEIALGRYKVSNGAVLTALSTNWQGGRIVAITSFEPNRDRR